MSRYNTPATDEEGSLGALKRQNKLLKTAAWVLLAAGLFMGWRWHLATKELRTANDEQAAYQGAVAAEVPAALFSARRDALRAAVMVEAESRKAAEQMAADSYAQGFQDGIACVRIRSVRGCLEELGYRSIPGYPGDPGYIPSSVRYPKDALQAMAALKSSICSSADTASSMTVAQQLGRPSVSWDGKLNETFSWLMAQGCRHYGSSVGGQLIGDPPFMADPWSSLSFTIAAEDRGVPAWVLGLFVEPPQ